MAMISLAHWLYNRVPIWFQNGICTAAGYSRNRERYDTDFDSRCEFFRESSLWSLPQVEAWQHARLKELLYHCRTRVPFYSNHRKQRYSGPDIFTMLEDWQSLPLLSKDDVRRAEASLISLDYSLKNLVVSHSGGSTGMPLRCYHDREALRQVYAHFWSCQRPGVSRKDKFATFQGLEIIPRSQRGGPYWRMNHAMHQRLYSIFHLSEQTIADYITDLDRFQPVYLAGYANSLYLLSQLAEELGIIPKHSPLAVFSTSETLFPAYRQTIERVFRTRVWDTYSQDETCGSITEYECGYYHYDRAYGYMEFLDLETLTDGRRLAEIVCTGFLNRAWPLLRYRPGDLVEYEPADRCPKCGRAGPIIHAIRGRTGDVLITPSGRRFPHISLIVKSLRGVRHVQLVQEAVDRVTIRFVPSETFKGAEDVKWMLDCFRNALDEPISWNTESVPEVSRTTAGKFKSIVNRIPYYSQPQAILDPKPNANQGAQHG